MFSGGDPIPAGSASNSIPSFFGQPQDAEAPDADLHFPGLMRANVRIDRARIDEIVSSEESILNTAEKKTDDIVKILNNSESASLRDKLEFLLKAFERINVSPEIKAAASLAIVNADQAASPEAKVDFLKRIFDQIKLPLEKRPGLILSVINADKTVPAAEKVRLLSGVLQLPLSAKGDTGKERYIVAPNDFVVGEINPDTGTIDLNSEYENEIAVPCSDVFLPPYEKTVLLTVPMTKNEANEFRKYGAPEFPRTAVHLCTNTPVRGIYGYPYNDGARNEDVVKALGDCSFLVENRKQRCDAIKEKISRYPAPPKPPTEAEKNLEAARIAGWFTGMGLLGGAAGTGFAFVVKAVVQAAIKRGVPEAAVTALITGAGFLLSKIKGPPPPPTSPTPPPQEPPPFVNNGGSREIRLPEGEPETKIELEKPAEKVAEEAAAEKTAEQAAKTAQEATQQVSTLSAMWMLGSAMVELKIAEMKATARSSYQEFQNPTSVPGFAMAAGTLGAMAVGLFAVNLVQTAAGLVVVDMNVVNPNAHTQS